MHLQAQQRLQEEGCVIDINEACHMCAPNLCVLKSAVLGNKDYNLGAIVARRLHNNRFNGDFLVEFMQPA